ncbi:MAG: hypothetical protein RMZ43_017495 [Nostoc sp. CmiVER01]|uniref:hypothetical protein n=1 Tax=Nostoc sp. CmiVER01 TaxID=3075384 RepID=UPI002AD42F48|nr:hypothetical protein [Nostoc sp. CmiVER01]MDZ8126983.1 hypothetical protein [Nostoc sp. CmiVER01]
MKLMLKDYFNPNQARIFTILILTGILFVPSSLTFIKSATGATAKLSLETSNEIFKDNIKLNHLPRPVANAVLQDLDRNNERSLRLALANNLQNKLPTSVKNAVLQAASKRLQQPISQLRIIEFQQQTWKNGCLELANADEFCTEALVPGWRVVVGKDEQTLVYHTNQTGSTLRLNEKASSSPLTPVRIPASELPPPLAGHIVFRQISSGGFAGRTYETVLLKDGQLIRVRIGDANDSERSVRRVSVQQVQQFVRSLERFQFSKFKNLSYPAPSGSADFITYTLTSLEGTVQYNDISRNNLPKNLQASVKAWNDLIASAK